MNFLQRLFGGFTLPPGTSKSSPTCLVCEYNEFYVLGDGPGENATCAKCGSLHQNTPFGLRLLRTGQPKPKVVLPNKEEITFDSDKEAFDWIKNNWSRGTYMVDSEGIVATDPLHKP